jgi:hypothetical protein
MGEEDGVRPRNEGAASATRCLAYLRLGNLRVVKADQSNLMWLGFTFGRYSGTGTREKILMEITCYRETWACFLLGEKGNVTEFPEERHAKFLGIQPNP